MFLVFFKFLVLLELRPESPRNLLRLQYSALLRAVLPAQRLGEPSPSVRQPNRQSAATESHNPGCDGGLRRGGSAQHDVDDTNITGHRQTQKVTYKKNA